jgi:hypothetical protein
MLGLEKFRKRPVPANRTPDGVVNKVRLANVTMAPSGLPAGVPFPLPSPVPLPVLVAGPVPFPPVFPVSVPPPWAFTPPERFLRLCHCHQRRKCLQVKPERSLLDVDAGSFPLEVFCFGTLCLRAFRLRDFLP